MSQLKVLIIEDTQGIREALSDIVTFEGIQAITANNGQEGVDKAKEHMPNLILCDIMMPIKDGYQVFEELRHDNEFKNTPFIFLTAKSDIDNVRQQLALGADDDIIAKPFNSDSLMGLIKEKVQIN
jgi:two-component system sensor histidine kinase/response regulator